MTTERKSDTVQQADGKVNELKPCPFCGSSAIDIPESRGHKPTLEEYMASRPTHVRCSNGQCGAKYVPGGFSVKEWNSRPASPKEAPTREGMPEPEVIKIWREFGYQTDVVQYVDALRACAERLQSQPK